MRSTVWSSESVRNPFGICLKIRFGNPFWNVPASQGQQDVAGTKSGDEVDDAAEDAAEEGSSSKARKESGSKEKALRCSQMMRPWKE